MVMCLMGMADVLVRLFVRSTIRCLLKGSPVVIYVVELRCESEKENNDPLNRSGLRGRLKARISIAVSHWHATDCPWRALVCSCTAAPHKQVCARVSVSGRMGGGARSGSFFWKHMEYPWNTYVHDSYLNLQWHSKSSFSKAPSE